jgi:hypothetical protein
LLAGVDAFAVPPLVIDGTVDPGPAYWAVVVVSPIVVAAGIYACLILRAGVGVTPGHVLVRTGRGRTTEVPWADVAGFEIGPGGFRDGRELSVLAAGGERYRTIGCAPGADAIRGWYLLSDLEDARLARVPGAVGDLPYLPPVPKLDPQGLRAARVVTALAVAAYIAACGGTIYQNLTALGPAVRASHGEGTAGYYIPQSQCGGRAWCSRLGEFRLPDGTVTRRVVDLIDAGVVGRNDPGTTVQVGVPVPAIDTGVSDGVFPRDDPGAWNAPASRGISGILLAALILPPAASWLRRRWGLARESGPDTARQDDRSGNGGERVPRAAGKQPMTRRTQPRQAPLRADANYPGHLRPFSHSKPGAMRDLSRRGVTVRRRWPLLCIQLATQVRDIGMQER